jgi:hypothetical protein
MYNLITAITNITCIFPIYRTYKRNDKITALTLSFVTIASIVSHLAENHKHGMIGLFDVSQHTSWLLNRLDVIGSILTIGRLSYLYYIKYGLNIIPNTIQWCLMLSPLIFLRISEYDKYNAELRDMYLVTHSIWHLSVFISMDYYLKNFIYI